MSNTTTEILDFPHVAEVRVTMFRRDMHPARFEDLVRRAGLEIGIALRGAHPCVHEITLNRFRWRVFCPHNRAADVRLAIADHLAAI